ncbi:hypothetical protein [Sulfuriroseicoccus oceanibius]|uniref:Uncharacterized protein n=1 Tax=Sulfuriroseicoccus oceanibius TaxID=2707525 RepID=A0A6B3LFK2_9BACT|nr:hypothetical protein [Sulfuriroseicoccus oceanibius]QQL44445.1 hypothetical protein G3M56_011190 [Sulfuriroseicoccus oceanibius]
MTLDRLLAICEGLEDEFDGSLDALDNRLHRLEEEFENRVAALQDRYPSDPDVGALQHLDTGLRRTLRLLRGKLTAIQENGDNLLEELGPEVLKHAPAIREKLASCSDIEQAAIEIQKEIHDSSASFRSFIKGMLMWKDSPEEHLEKKE